MKTFLRSIPFLILMLCTTFLATSQDRQGNIVEYFGKEKVNEINEGKLFHVFKEGLAVQVQNQDRNAVNFIEDPVFDHFLANASYHPKSGDVFDVNGRGNAMKWETINVDSTNTFNGRSLRSSYVYLDYESKSEKIVLFEASGHSVALVNGFPHEGDHYDFGYSLIPIKLKKGRNSFLVKVGRFPRIRARLIEPSSPLVFTSRDMTLPDLLKEDAEQYLGGIRVVNSSEEWMKNLKVNASNSGKTESKALIDLPPLSVTKIVFKTPTISNPSGEESNIDLAVVNEKGKTLASTQVTLKVKSKHDHHKRTFLSEIDHSVQYFSVAPTSDQDSDQQALFLSVHGASVEATNQARAYKKKDWGTLVAPTNRRPFGFAWEDWGRIDAMEVLSEAKSIYKPDPQKVYLTGHSMGGHGTWYLGATYPDHFAAIAPCAGYPDLLAYRNSFTRRLRTMSAEQLKRFGMTPEMVAEMSSPPAPEPIDAMIQRAGNPSRTLKIKRNYLHHGVYILHGEKDNVVPTFIARDMRQTLGEYHNDFEYYEYPDGTHWYGDHSVDWFQIFDFFKARTIPESKSLKKLEFYTASPGVSASSHFITIHQQEKPFEVSSFNFNNEEGFVVDFENTAVAEIDFTSLEETPKRIIINGQDLETGSASKLFLKKDENKWQVSSAPSKMEKGPHRNGNFKDAFRNQVVFVYGTSGNAEENQWNKMKAMFDAETFYYRANGKVEVIQDVDFSAAKYADRNVVIYGNKDNNSAWGILLKDCPIQVGNGQISIDGTVLNGDAWGSYFIYPRKDSDSASIGVITGTGMAGMKATYANHYLVNGTSFPDFTLFDSSVLKMGLEGIKCAGFFGNDWSFSGGDFQWK